RLRISAEVRFLGYQQRVDDLMNELDVVVSASHVEPFGRTIIEAMACGKPVVATRVGGVPEIVVEGTTGLLVDPGAPRQLADAAERLLRDERLRSEMGANGRKRVIEDFSLESHVEAILAVYERLAERR
ncbi:MAG: glycosyltransferase family 4 protein, partial [Candidatus Binatia bacterium]